MNHLYGLIPEMYRTLDRDEGWPLRAFMSVLESQYAALHANIGLLYDNAFIETCAPWAVPYIAELLGTQGLSFASQNVPSQRARVANALGCRSFKGTLPALSRAVADTTGWPCVVTDGIDHVAAAQALAAPRPALNGSPNIASVSAMNDVGGPFGTVALTVDVARGGISGLADLRLHLWRLGACTVSNGQPRSLGQGRFMVHPFGIDQPLFIPMPPWGGGGIERQSLPREVPQPLTRRTLAADLQRLRRPRAEEARRLTPLVRSNLDPHRHADGTRQWLDRLVSNRVTGMLAERNIGGSLCFTIHPAIAIRVGEGEAAYTIPPERIVALDLSDWPDLPDEVRWAPGPDRAVPVEAAVDPELGRILLPKGWDEAVVRVDFAYGCTADLGGGPYPRAEDVDTLTADAGMPAPRRVWQALVCADLPADAPMPPDTHRTLSDALAAWREAGADGMIRIADNAIHEIGPALLDVGALDLAIVAEDGCRPCIAGSLTFAGGGVRHGVLIDGAWVRGSLTVSGDVDMVVRHCTVVPANGGIAVSALDAAGAAGPSLRITDSIVGPITATPDTRALFVVRSIVDGGGHGGDHGGRAISGTDGAGIDGTVLGPPVALDAATVLGNLYAYALQADNALVTGEAALAVVAPAKIRHSVVTVRSLKPATMDAVLPARFIALPKDGGAGGGPAVAFDSRRYGDPAFARPSRGNPSAVLSGGSGGEQVGAYHDLCENQRIANIGPVLDELLPQGLLWGIELVT